MRVHGTIERLALMVVGASLCASLQAAPRDAAARCASLAAQAPAWSETTMRLEQHRLVAATAQLPAHCEVIGRLRKRTGLHGQQYAVRFHLRLPVAWNRRLLFQGGGGSNGEIGNAEGPLGPGSKPALALGYAVVSQDSGHDNTTNNDPAHNGALAFGFDAVARADYGHASLKPVAVAARQALRRFYGEPLRFSYFVGCSKSGQEGMVFAQRHPELFDGILAAAPGFSLPRAAVAAAWDVQVFGAILGAPLATQLHKSFSDADFGLVRGALLEACDADDGLADGIVADGQRCTDAKVMPRLRARMCSGEKVEGCLSAAQIEALLRSRHGPQNSKGEALYSDWPWAAGVAGPDWRIWKVGLADGSVPALNVVLIAPVLASVFTTPPTVVGADPASLADFQSRFDIDRDAPKIYATGQGFPHSAWTDLGARSSDLAAFRRRGGRMIVPHGDSDPFFSLNDTLAWWREVDRRNDGKAARFVRVFPVPGMCHCTGGQAVAEFDAFAALVKWVEQGSAPDALAARAGPASPWPGRERPLCAYPEVARYKGSGDPEQAASFSCRP